MIEKTTSSSRRLVVVLLILASLGFVARLGLWQISRGSNDSTIWAHIGLFVARDGLLKTYHNESDCNQPPGQPYLASVAFRISHATGTMFAKWWKVPMLLGDVLVAVLLWKIIRLRRGSLTAAAIVALFAWNPIAILVSAHHGNTDSLYTAISLLAVWLMEDRRRFFLGGLALGAAINIKLVPVLLIAPLLASCTNREQAVRFVCGLAVMAIPSVVVLMLAPEDFTSRVLMYTPMAEHWGIGHLLLEFHESPKLQSLAAPAILWFNANGRNLVLLSILLLSAAQWFLRRWDRYTITAITLTMFLIFAPGFGVQYAVAPAALLLLCRVTPGVAYGLIGGAYLFASYWLRWDGTLPIETRFYPEFNYVPGRLFGLLAWAILLCAAWLMILRPKNLAADNAGDEDRAPTLRAG